MLTLCAASQEPSRASKALSDVSLTVFPGKIHSLMGENGAGKSTLMKILSGAYQADPVANLHRRQTGGFIEGPLSRPRPSRVAVIYQELSLCPELSVAENIYQNANCHGPRVVPQWKPRATTSSNAWAPTLARKTVVRICRSPSASLVEIARAAFEGEDPGHGRANHAAFVA